MLLYYQGVPRVLCSPIGDSASQGRLWFPALPYMATVSAMIWAGLQPVFADVDVHTLTLDPTAAEAAITPNTRALVAIHNFGNPADIEALQTIAAAITSSSYSMQRMASARSIKVSRLVRKAGPALQSESHQAAHRW
jgi:DegT/DnrJ/EryC1/StrS aminotransferase family